MRRLSRPAMVAALAGVLGCDPGSPDPDAAVPNDAAADGTADAAPSDAAVGSDAAPRFDAGDIGDAASAPDASLEEDSGGEVSVECEQADDFAVPVDPTGVVSGAAAAARTGGFVVAWAVASGIETFVRARLLDRCAMPEGDELEVDATGMSIGSPVAAAVGGAEDFVIAWSREDGDDDGAGVVYRRFGPDGDAIGAQLVANEQTFDDQIASSAAALPGGFALAWTDYSGGPFERPDAVFATFDGAGAPHTAEALTSPSDGGSQEDALLVAGDGGVVLTTWTDDGSRPLARRLELAVAWIDADALELAEAEVRAAPTGTASDGEAFAVALEVDVWSQERDVELVLLPGEDGDVASVSVAANEADERKPFVGAWPGGGWIVAWTDDAERDAPGVPDPSGTTVRAVRVERDGSVGIAFVVPTTTDFDQELAALAAAPGGALMVWLDASRADGDRDGSLRARLVPGGGGEG